MMISFCLPLLSYASDGSNLQTGNNIPSQVSASLGKITWLVPLSAATSSTFFLYVSSSTDYSNTYLTSAMTITNGNPPPPTAAPEERLKVVSPAYRQSYGLLTDFFVTWTGGVFGGTVSFAISNNGGTNWYLPASLGLPNTPVKNTYGISVVIPQTAINYGTTWRLKIYSGSDATNTAISSDFYLSATGGCQTCQCWWTSNPMSWPQDGKYCAFLCPGNAIFGCTAQVAQAYNIAVCSPPCDDGCAAPTWVCFICLFVCHSVCFNVVSSLSLFFFYCFYLFLSF